MVNIFCKDDWKGNLSTYRSSWSQVILTDFWGFQIGPPFGIMKIKQNFDRFQEIQKQANSESYSSLSHVEPKNLQRSTVLGPRWPGPLNSQNKRMINIEWNFSDFIHPIRMSHWRRWATEGAEFWISCKQPAILSNFSCLQVIQNKRPWCSASAYVTAGLIL